MPLFWDNVDLRFEDEDGNVVSSAAVRAEVQASLSALNNEVESLCQRLAGGEIELSTWQIEMERLIKRAHTFAGAIGGGGWSQMSQSYWGATGQLIRQQYEFLRAFVRQMEDGLMLDGDFYRRAKMYIQSGLASYEEIFRREHARVGFTHERRVIRSGDPCNPCLSYAGQGWVPIMTLPRIAEECDCHSNCQCQFQFERREAA